MAFLLDKGIAAESEEEFDAETDRYEELRSRLLGGRTLKYEEMEELLAAAKARNDQKVIGVLKNVVDDPATDGVGPLAEAELDQDDMDDIADTFADYAEGPHDKYRERKQKIQDFVNSRKYKQSSRADDLQMLRGQLPHDKKAPLAEAQLSQEEMDDIASMFAAYSGMSYGGDDVERRERARETAAFMQRHAGELRQLLDQPSQAEGFGDFSRATDLEFNESEDPDFDTDKDYYKMLQQWRAGRLPDKRDQAFLQFKAWRHGDKNALRELGYGHLPDARLENRFKEIQKKIDAEE